MKSYEEEYLALRDWLSCQLDEAMARSTAMKPSEDPEVVAARKAAIIEYNRMLDEVKRKYGGM